MDIYSPSGNRKQSAVNSAEDIKSIMGNSPSNRFGVIIAVHTFDDPVNIPGTVTGSQGYITYDVKLSPQGIVIQNVPARTSASGHVIDNNTPNAAPLTQQNTEEYPLGIGQPVEISFINGSNFNPIIEGPAPCQYNAGSQSASEYPQIRSVFQGSSDIRDKNGNRTINLVSGGTLTIEVNGVPFLTIDGATGKLVIGNGSHPGVLGDALISFLSGHVHSGVQTGSGFSGASPTSTAGIESSFYTVQ
jgi:hypothetical protein